MRCRWAGVALVATLTGSAGAQLVPPQPVSDSTAAVSIRLLTIGPGDEVWELWGHNTIIVTDPRRGTSRSYNWGLFNFRQDNFILRFARGQMWYSMGSAKTDRELARYAGYDRSMVLQDLSLTPAQAASLREFLLWNDTNENRFYHYNYYLDNCSTRVRDAIDRVLGGQLKARFDTIPSGHTWRWETRRILGSNLPLYVVINLALGQPVDREMTAWEAMFLPLRVQEYLGPVHVDEGGSDVRLVRSEEEAAQSSQYREPVAPARTWLPLLIAGLLAGGGMMWLGSAARTSRRARRWFGVIASSWSFGAGLLGVLLLFLWFLSDHWTSSRNENVLLLTPLSLGLSVLIPLALRGRAGAVRAAGRLAAAVAALAALALVIKVLPWFPQYNLELITLILPVHAGLFMGLKRATTPT